MLKALIVTATLIATPLTAETGANDPCKVIGDVSEGIMLLRQEGQPMSDVMQLANGNEMLELIIIAAYEQPRYNTDRIKIETIQDFRNDMEAICYSAM